MYAVERAIFTHRCLRIRVRGCRTVPSERTRRIPLFVASRSHVFCVPFDGYSQRDGGATTVTTVYISCQYEQITVMQSWKKEKERERVIEGKCISEGGEQGIGNNYAVLLVFSRLLPL